MQKSEKSLEPFLRKLRYQPTNYYQRHRSEKEITRALAGLTTGVIMRK